MASFKDRKGNIWDVELVYTTLKRLKDRLGLDVGKLVADELKPLVELYNDPCRMVEVLYVMCEDQIRQRNMSDEDFGRLFDGDTIAAGVEAWESSLITFFQKSNPMLKKVFDKAKQVTEKSHKLIEAKLDSLSVDEIIAKAQHQKSSAKNSNE